MAKFDVDGQYFEKLKASIKNLSDVLSNHQQTEAAIHALAENRAKQEGVQGDDLDTKTYLHKKALKKIIEENNKNESNQGAGGPGQMPQGNYTPANSGHGASAELVNMPRMQHTSGVPTTATPNATPQQQGMTMPGSPIAGVQRSYGPPAPRMASPTPPTQTPSYQGWTQPGSPNAQLP